MSAPTLPRRPYLGVDVSTSLRIEAVTPGCAADAAGLRPGDLVLQVGKRAVHDRDDFLAALAQQRDNPFSLTVRRDQRKLCVELAPPPMPLEVIPGARIELGQLSLGAGELRTISALPSEGRTKFNALYLPGLGRPSCEFPLEPETPALRWFEALARLGVASHRIEPSGAGDSSGPLRQDLGLADDLAFYERALDALATHYPEPWLLLGHSLGGMLAPLLSPTVPVAGVMVFSTSALPWRAVTEQNARAQFEARHDANTAADLLGNLVALHDLIYDAGLTPEAAYRRQPELREVTGYEGESLFGRSAHYFRSLDRVDLKAAWRALDVPVLIVVGTRDPTTRVQDGAEIAELVGARGQLVVLEGVGHQLCHEDKTLPESFSQELSRFLETVAQALMGPQGPGQTQP